MPCLGHAHKVVADINTAVKMNRQRSIRDLTSELNGQATTEIFLRRHFVSIRHLPKQYDTRHGWLFLNKYAFCNFKYTLLFLFHSFLCFLYSCSADWTCRTGFIWTRLIFRNRSIQNSGGLAVPLLINWIYLMKTYANIPVAITSFQHTVVYTKNRDS